MQTVEQVVGALGGLQREQRLFVSLVPPYYVRFLLTDETSRAPYLPATKIWLRTFRSISL